jgi:hypothetical protein
MRKRRTRAHIIEDLGFNHVERQVLLTGYTLERIIHDYGYDGHIQPFDDNGEVEGGLILLQLKSTDKLKLSEKDDSIRFDLSVRDLEFWLSSPNVMVLIVYDAQSNEAFFVELKDYFDENRSTLSEFSKFVRVYIPRKNVLSPLSIKNLKII